MALCLVKGNAKLGGSTADLLRLVSQKLQCLDEAQVKDVFSGCRFAYQDKPEEEQEEDADEEEQADED